MANRLPEGLNVSEQPPRRSLRRETASACAGSTCCPSSRQLNDDTGGLMTPGFRRSTFLTESRGRLASSASASWAWDSWDRTTTRP